MESFQRVGDEILRRFRAVELDESAFPDLVVPVLEEARLFESTTLESLVDGVLEAEKLPPASVSKVFSDAGICVYHDTSFAMEVLTWLDASTMIHAHKFCGAFQVLVGGSLHTQYSFAEERRVSEQLSFGRLERSRVEHLVPGSIARIRAGSAFIHRLFHLERPSLSLVVRTFVQGAVPQYAYLEPGIRYDPFRRPPELDQRIKLLRVLERLDHPGFVERLKRRILGSDLYSSFYYAIEFVHALRAKGLLDEVLPAIRERFREQAPILEAAADQRWRYERIIGMRGTVTDPEHRFFLALLLNASDRSELFDLIRTRYRTDAPEETAVRWIEELSGADGPFSFDEAELEQLAAWVHRDARARGDLHVGLRDSILRPLFR